MAVDTETKRRSVLAATIMALAVAPVPDGTVAAVDRQHIVGIYGGIAAGAPGVSTTAIHIFATGTVGPNSASDSGDNVLVAGVVESQGGIRVGGASNYTDIDASGFFTQAGTAITTLDQLYLNEITTPSAVANDGALYTKTNNGFFFQDGAGNEHLIHGEAFGSMWFHDTTAGVVAIAATDTLTKITSFANSGSVDDSGRVTVSTANNELTLSSDAAGIYDVSFHASITAAGASKEMVIVAGIELATAQTIATATNASPIVIGITGHEKLSGDCVTISGCTGNTAANGDWVVTRINADTFSIKDLNGTASTGNGAYDADSGSVDIWYPGCLVMHREVSQTNLGVGGGDAKITLAASDKIGLYVANIDDANDLNVFAIVLNAERSGE